MNMRRAIEVVCAALLALALIIGINFSLASLITPRFSIGGPFGPPIEVGVWYEFVGRPRPNEPVVIIRFMLVGDPGRPSKVLLNAQNYLRYDVDIEVHIYFYGPEMRIIAHSTSHLFVKSREEVHSEAALSWTAEATLKDIIWGELNAEVTGRSVF